PHMGYPLTRGAVRQGILTCDWHGRSFDLEGGGCFNYECDDLQTFPVDIRQDEIWIALGDAQYKRRDEHLRLLWEGLLSEDRWTRMFSHDGQAGRIERCLFTAYHLDYENKILPLLYECAVKPHFLGVADNLLSLGYLAEVVESFGWERSSELVFNLGAKLLGRRRGEPERFRRDAVCLMASAVPIVEASNPSANTVIEYDEAVFVNALLSVNI